MKIFFDTNVYVGRALTGGPGHDAIRAALRGRWRVFITDYLLEEVERVLIDKLGRSARTARLVRKQIADDSRLIRTGTSRHRVPRDAKDDAILAAAVSIGVDYLVTNDKDLLDFDPYEGVRIISLKAFLVVLRNHGMLPS